MTTEKIKKMMMESMKAKEDFFSQAENIEKTAEKIAECFKKGGKILIFGNGGSAADSQHIAGELVGRFKLERKALPAIALTTDTSILTAWSNDYDFSEVFERQVEALAKRVDILVGISTSGNSENVIRAFKKGKEMGTFNISMTGKDGGKLKPISDLNINSSSNSTPRIQECHILAYHIFCDLIENKMFGKNLGVENLKMEENSRPWGRYDVLHKDSGSTTKIIRINPGMRFSLQFHKKREEHWVVVRGEGKTTLGESEIEVKAGSYVYVPTGEIHRMEAYGEGLDFIETQVGVCDEDDIVRLEDDFGRINQAK